MLRSFLFILFLNEVFFEIRVNSEDTNNKFNTVFFYKKGICCQFFNLILILDHGIYYL
jgi:hypothetical protein